MTPEIEKATQDWITAERDYNEADQNYEEIRKQAEKRNPDYAKTRQKLDKLRKQLEELKTKEYKLEEQISIEEQKVHKIFETIRCGSDYKMAYNHLVGAGDKRCYAQNYLERLIAKEAENDATKH